MTAFYIPKWIARFLLVLLIYPCVTARVGQLDWMAKEIDNKQWCGKSDYCDSFHQLDDASTTEFSIEVNNGRTTMNPSDMEDDRFLERLCHCDEECQSYGDCCYDASSADVRHMINNNITDVKFSRNSLACLPLRFKDNDYTPDQKYYIYMIDECPTSRWFHDNDDESLPALCQKKTNPSDYTHLIDIPVLSLETNRTYANVFCAQCHSDAARLAHWNVSIECNEDINKHNISRAQMFNQSNYMPGFRRWVLQSPRIRSSIRCHIVIDEFLMFSNYLKSTGSRRCLPKIDSCAANWTHAADEARCHAYTFLVQTKSTSESRGVKVYKNPHCAKCNHVETNDTHCYFPIRIDSRFRAVLPGRTQYSFSMLIDFDFGGSGAGGERKGTVCGPKEIFDRFHNRCHAIICGAMFVNEGGICIPKPELQVDVTAGNRLNSSCQRLVLMENLDYIQLNNDSLILNATGKMLHPEQYEPIEEGQNVSICSDHQPPDNYFKYASTGQHYMSDICLVISVVCLAIHIIVHIILPKLRNLPGKNLLSLSCALFMAQLLFLTGIGLRETVGYHLCATLGVLTHWFYLAAFFWMNVMGFDICRTFTGSFIRHRGMQGRGQRCTFLFYSFYAWGFPTLIVSLGLMLDLTHLMDDYAPEYGTRVCWISNKTGLGFFFILPVAVLLFENLILFSLTVFSILKQRKAARFAVDKKQSYRKTNENKSSLTERLQPPPGPTAPMRHSSAANNKQKIRFILYIKLGLIMGMGWIFGFIAALAKIPALWYPFIFFNALQGAFIFVAFCCKRKIYFMLYQWATNRPHPSDSSSGSRTTASTNKPSTSTQSGRTSVAAELPSNSAAEFESQPNRFGRIVRESTQPQQLPLAAERLLPQVAAVEIVRNWINSASPVSRAKRNLPRVVVTKHFVNDDEFYPRLFDNRQNSTYHLYVQNNNHSASPKS